MKQVAIFRKLIMIYRHGKNFIAVITLLLACSSAEAHPLPWYYYNSKAWAKAAAAIVFATYAVKTDNHKSGQKKPEQDVPYTINVMWLNKDLKVEEPYLIQPKDKLIREKYISAPCIWAIKNPESTVQFWYDSELASQDAIGRTKNAIDARMRSCPKSAPIIFRDIRGLQHVKDNPEVFSSKTPVYFRADLTRVIAGYEEVQKTKSNFVYADFDVKPMRKDDLFDDVTKRQLASYGMVMTATAEDCLQKYENSFYILSPNEQNMLKSLKLTIIDLNIQRASYSLNSFYRYFMTIPHPETVYRSFPATYAYLYHLQGLGILKVNGKTPYDEKLHGLAAFGVSDMKGSLRFEVLGEDSENRKGTLGIPTKKVDVPPASCDYY